MKSYEYRAGVVQTLAKLGDEEANLEICNYYVKQATMQGVKLLVFPECMNAGYLYNSPEHARKVAGQMDSRFVKGLAKMARDNDMFIASGMIEWDPERQKIFNTGILLDKKGDLILHYHKQFLTTHDQNWFTFGERGFPVVATELGKLGMMICFDGRIPEIPRCTALNGAQVIVDMANFFLIDQAETWRPARAYENGVWICAASKSGQERSIHYPGGSMIIDPKGNLHAQIPWDTHGLAVSEIDPTLADNKHLGLGADRFADRRPDTYTVLTKPYKETAVANINEEAIIPSKAVFNMAAVQSHVCETQPTTLDQVATQTMYAAQFGIRLIVLPEYVASPNWRIDAAEAQRLADLNAELVRTFSILCKENKCAVLVPNVEKIDGKLYPTSFLIGPEGKTILSYRKVHLFADERKWATAGSEYPVANTPFGRIGIIMGYDSMFSEAARCLGVNGADVILWPARLQNRNERRYLALTLAVDNRCALILANRIDAPYSAGSLVVPPSQFPTWDVEAVTEFFTEMHKVVFDVVELAATRQKNLMSNVHMFANRIPKTYGPLVEKR
ncbi:nitrilase/cyanide hydratase and apolipoprotein N-acyltransferase [Candidatus Nitrosoglobus terrae]|uniref:Nitrilase/cyanide hydratase and apolipoprotein N-acyltransferase n=1 Tax=Candidatus Nitrosoglobus terrae TaxID=1630141 RepID=A0A1Q2SKJ0_9GAMM|nr:carbon-nitrogen hydrolase family protein [Candidatus Nitrosoglobus terrae]BAW79622.1 nitrilase/cyanide hydratase and apolipoprotein N-acyltransferase [Candidatus Nitrosoglobus terrae]